MKKVLYVMSWVLALIPKIVISLLGVVVVFPMVKLGKEWAPWQREDKRRPYTYEEMAIRNPAGGMAYWFRHPRGFYQEGSGTVRKKFYVYDNQWNAQDSNGLPVTEFEAAFPEPWTLKELREKSGWRWRMSGKFASFRYVRLRKGGAYYSEFYIGWKLGSAPPLMDFAFSPRGWLNPRKVGT